MARRARRYRASLPHSLRQICVVDGPESVVKVVTLGGTESVTFSVSFGVISSSATSTTTTGFTDIVAVRTAVAAHGGADAARGARRGLRPLAAARQPVACLHRARCGGRQLSRGA